MCGHLVVHRNNKVTLSLSRELIRGEPIIPILRRHTFIMNDYPSNVKQKLNSIIADMSEHHWLFSNNPGHNFMRQHQGKLSFYDTMRLIIDMGKGTTNDEIMDYFDMVPDLIPSQSAFNQRRSQISLSAFEYLFRNSPLRFRLLQINSRIIVSLPVMAAMLSTLLILKLLRITTSLVSSTIKDTTICT